jgi:hypothetical protein
MVRRHDRDLRITIDLGVAFGRKENLMARDVAIVKRQEMVDMYYYEVLDERLQKHSVQLPKSILTVEPQHYLRGTDQQHLDIIACGVVLMRSDLDTCFHRVDRESVDRAYEAALTVESFDRLGSPE